MAWSRFIPAGAFVILVVFLGIGLTRDPSLIPTEMINRDMPAFELTELYDETQRVTDTDLIGEPALVNVFGSWCVACLQEHPTLMQLNQDDTVRIVGVNWRDGRDDAIKWLQRHGDPYETIIFDGESDLAIEMGVTGAPETFILDRTGRIRFKQIGPITSDVWRETIRPVLDALAAEELTTPAPVRVESDAVVDSDVENIVLTDLDLIGARTEAVSKTLRCVVCQNQSIYDSNAPLAQDMRRLVRKRVVAGDSDEEVRDYMRYRYGDYVLMSPPLQLNTFLLWLAPLALVLFGGIWFVLRGRNAAPTVDDTLTEADRNRVAAALAKAETET
ncbi:MAG: DsbE family thiol:disulfide interchange protein [Hyphomonas sp.]|jgi:cytochrome c biogenesis protein CcmG/thiol:disulfide interchange protein DsbE|nr:DsbE family thiol:disulfide interchange protein [Hyphomonas sp.]